MMKRDVRVSLATVCTVFVLADVAWSDGYRNPPPTAAGIATAGAGYAWTEGAAAVAGNPAGLLDLTDTEIQISAAFTRLSATYEPAGTGLRLASRKEWNVLPNFFVGAPSASGAWAWGLGVATPYGQSMEWRADDPAPWRYLRPYEASMLLVEASPAAAFHVNDRLSLGVALSVYTAGLQFDQHVPSLQLFGTPGPDAGLLFDGEATAVGGTVGVHWTPVEPVRFAVSYKVPVRLRFKGDVQMSHPALPPGIPAGSFRTTIELPDTLAVACGVRVGENLRVELSVEHMGWSRHKEQTISVRGALPIPDQQLAHRWDDTWTAGLAGEWTLRGPWSVRGGYRFMGSPVPDETYSLIFPDADRHIIGIGIGYVRGRHRVDAAWSYSEFRTRRISVDENPALAGRHTLTADLAGLSYRYTF